MIGYATIGVNDFERALDFYDKVLAPLGGKRTLSFGDRMQMYGNDGPGTIGICRPANDQPATAGNGSMFGFPAPSNEAIDEAHALALANGGTCEGPPGPRGDQMYAAYFRDPEGNKLCAFRFKA